MQSMKPELQRAFENILDTLTGADGGVKFMAYKAGLEEMSKRESEGDRQAAEVLAIVVRFSRLLDVLGEKFGSGRLTRRS